MSHSMLVAEPRLKARGVSYYGKQPKGLQRFVLPGVYKIAAWSKSPDARVPY